ncbi:MAG: uncharacterized LabA/DUF88 family protein, partial [Marinobacter psychrophilus]
KQTHAVETAVYGVRKLTAASLIDAADHFYPIDETMLL